jgi:flagellar L-ring protein precursor FlgH
MIAMSRACALAAALASVLAAAGCNRLEEVGKAPDFSPFDGGLQHHAMHAAPLPRTGDAASTRQGASLWSSARGALYGDRRAARRGDILTVVIEIDDRAEMRNSSDRSRDSETSMGIPEFFGLPQRIDLASQTEWEMGNAVSGSGGTSFSGEGTVRRNERLTLRIAATVVDELPNGILRLEGEQEVRVNNELRQLLVSGYVRPTDISRQNEIGYDKIAGARISYGGRGLVSDVQQPGWGQQVADIVLPF